MSLFSKYAIMLGKIGNASSLKELHSLKDELRKFSGQEANDIFKSYVEKELLLKHK